MFWVFPIGSDQAAYDRPYLTYGIALICLLVQIWAATTSGDHALAIHSAGQAFFEELELDPGARIAPAVADELPANVRGELDRWITDDPFDPAIDDALGHAALGFGEAVRQLPALRLGYVPAERRPHTLLTYQITHGGWMHVIGNIVFLIVAGGVLECFWRHWAYLLLFALSGVAGALLHGAVTGDPMVPLVGASGAIAGLMAGFLLGHARARIHLLAVVWLFVFIRTFKISIVARYLIPIWAAFQVWSMTGSEGGVAYGAHVGGFVAGLGLTLLASRAGLVARDAGYA